MTLRSFLQLFCLAYPRDFRRQYRAQILGDYDQRMRDDRGGVAFGGQLLLDVLFSGLVMRLEFAVRDVNNALRRLRKTPLVAAVIVLTFALGIGANVAVFSVLNAVLLRPLPFANTARLVSISQVDERIGKSLPAMSQLDSQDILSGTTTLQNVALYGEDSKTLTGYGKPIELNVSTVTWTFFDTVGVHSELGRLFTSQDAQQAHYSDPMIPQSLVTPTIVISDRLWRSRLGADPAAIGKSLNLDGTAYRVIGVTPAGFNPPGYGGLFPADAYLVVPKAAPQAGRGARWMLAVALLRPRVSLAAAQSDVNRVQLRLKQLYPAYENRITALQPLRDAILGPSTSTLLWMIFVAVIGVFLIMCANIASLLLTQSGARQGEISMRQALGATRGRIVTQLLTESGMLAVAGGLIGIACAYFALQFFVAVGAGQVPRLATASIDLPVMVFAVAVVMCATIVSGAAPSWMLASSARLPLGRNARRATSVNRRAQSVLVAAELAVALALVTAAGLSLRGFYGLTHADMGIRTRDVLASQIFPLTNRRFPTVDAKRAALQRLQSKLDALPGAETALAAGYPMSGVTMSLGFAIQGQHYAAGAAPAALLNAVSPQYFDVLGIPLKAGRTFTERDRAGAPLVAVVNSAFLKLLRGKSALNARVMIPVPNDPAESGMRGIVGVVGDVRDGPTAPVVPEIYVPVQQGVMPWITAIARGRAGNPQTLRPEIENAFASIDPLAQAPNVRAMDQIVGDSAASARLSAALFTALGLIALLLAIAGVFGVVSYSVSQRFQEFGIRMAIGSSAGGVVRTVLGSIAAIIGTGIAVGLVLAAIAGRAVGSQLYQVQAIDPVVLTAVALLLIGAALLSALLPALRAARVDPATALRYE